MSSDDSLRGTKVGAIPTSGSGSSSPSPNPWPGTNRPSSVAVGLFIIAAIAFLRFAQPFLLPVVLALLLHFLLLPAMNALQRARIPRPLGAAILMVLLVGSVALGLSTLQKPAKEWLGKIPAAVRRFEEEVRGLRSRLVPRMHTEVRTEAPPPTAPPSPEEERRETRWLQRMQDALLSFTALTQTAAFLSGCLETAVLLFFLMAAGDTLLRRVIHVLPTQHDKDEAVAIVNEVQRNVSTYLAVTATINVCVGLLVALTMYGLGLETPMLWGVLAALLNFVPYFGPFTVFVILLLAGSFSFDATGRGFLPALLFLAIHATESNLITPAALGRRLTLNPVIIFLALMFWTWLWGIPGALLSVPLLMTFRILCEHFSRLRWMGDLLCGSAGASHSERKH